MTSELNAEMGSAGMLAWKRIAESLEEEIRAGRYGVGTLLPPSATLAAQFGVHRHTVRQAFKHLAERGLVSVERGRGTEVLPQRFPYRIGRRVSLRTNFGAAGMRVESQLLHVATEPANRLVAQELAVPPGTRLHVLTTLNRAEGVPVSKGLHYVDATAFPEFPERLLASGASFSGAFAAYGIEDYIRLETRLSARLPTREEAESLQISPDSPVLQSIGVDARPDHSPIQLVVGAFVGARMEMIVEPFTEPAR